MKITKTNSSGISAPIIVLIVAAALIVGLGVTAYAVKLWPFEDNASVNSSDTTSSNPDPGTNATKTDITVPDDTSTKTTDQIPVDTGLSASIDTLNQTDTAVTFNGSVNSKASGGKCSIVFTNPNDKPVSRTVDAAVSGERSTCGPIDIPTGEFSYLGTWSLTFRYYVNDAQAVATKDVVIE